MNFVGILQKSRFWRVEVEFGAEILPQGSGGLLWGILSQITKSYSYCRNPTCYYIRISEPLGYMVTYPTLETLHSAV